MLFRFLTWVFVFIPSFSLADEISEAKSRWADSPHGPFLERLLPPTFEARQLPERRSAGAQLVVRYCVQCHNLPNPAMQHAATGPGIVESMVLRMEGSGNMGTLMSEMIAGVNDPQLEETKAILADLGKHAKRPID